MMKTGPNDSINHHLDIRFFFSFSFFYSPDLALNKLLTQENKHKKDPNDSKPSFGLITSLKKKKFKPCHHHPSTSTCHHQTDMLNQTKKTHISFFFSFHNISFYCKSTTGRYIINHCEPPELGKYHHENSKIFSH